METFIARQPIFDSERNVYAYELLFRAGVENMCRHPDLTMASSKVISDTVNLLGLDVLTGGRRAFVNLTQDVLLREYALLLSPQAAVAEVLETVEPSDDVLRACNRLKAAGYHLALDDFADRPGYAPLLRLADFVKIDVQTTPRDEIRAMAQRFAGLGARLLAEKVETHEMFEETRDLGFSYFQGYFFAKPTVLAAKDIPGYRLHYFRILQEIHRPDLEFAKIEGIIKQDLSLCYKFLRFVNSAYFGWTQPVDSIRRALVLLGEREVRKWISLVVLTAMAGDKPQELVAAAVTRGRFCELLGPAVGMAERSEELFLSGMFSLLDAILDRPLVAVLKDLPVSGDVRAALLERSGPLGPVLACVEAYDKGDWDAFASTASTVGMDEAHCPSSYLDAIRWCRQGLEGAAAA